ncbi:MAG: hypothetical protein MUF84_09500 [Anaerolineae bacterium]|jgi:RNase P subunit RPR2|nr:hypothetical protein [Anaerolineae bacterium]
MAELKMTHCPTCGAATPHDVYVSRSGQLHTLCTDCGHDVRGSADVKAMTGEVTKPCMICGTATEHVRYTDSVGYIHWFCLSCGKDVRSGVESR